MTLSKNAEYNILLYILHLLRVIIVHEKVQRKLEVFQRQNMRVTMTVTYQLRSNYSRPGKIDTGKIAFVHKKTENRLAYVILRHYMRPLSEDFLIN